MKGRHEILLVLFLLAVVGCGAPQGKAVYRDLRCAACHGTGLEGSPRGPSLLDLGRTWNSDEALAAYLQAPAISKRSGLEEISRNFKLRMLPVEDLSEQEILILASWLRNPAPDSD